MKRPLFYLAMVLTLGIYILSFWERGDSQGIFGSPLFFQELEVSGLTKYYRSYTAKVLSVEEKEDKTVVLTDGGDDYGRVLVSSEEDASFPALFPGDEVNFSGYFYCFSDSTNPGEFSFKRYYEGNGIFGGYIASNASVQKKTTKTLVRKLLSYKEQVKKFLKENTSAEDYGFFYNYLFNSQAFLEEGEKDAYDGMGLLYLFSQSGFVLSMIFYRLYRLFRRPIGNRFLSGTLVVFLSVLYGFWTGFTISFLRGFLFLLFRIAAHVTKRKFDYLSASAAAILFLLIENPRVVFLPAFASYLAVTFSLGILYPLIQSCFFRSVKWFGFLSLLLCMQIFLLPVNVYSSFTLNPYQLLFGSFFLIVRLAVMGVVILSSLLFTFLPEVSRFLLEIGHYLHLLFYQLAEWESALPFSKIVVGRPETWKAILYAFLCLLLIALFLYKKERLKRIPEEKEVRLHSGHRLAVIGVLALVYGAGFFLLNRTPLSDSEGRVVMLDVGQGDGFLVLSGDRAMILDGGSSSKKKLGDTLRDALYYYGYDRVDQWVITHGDGDHTSGLVEVLERNLFPVTEILVGWREDLSEYAAIPRYETMAKGDAGSLSAFQYHCLWPDLGSPYRTNDGSTVLRITYRDFSMLFTGDISEAVEPEIAWEEADLLKVSHHGSRYSTKLETLALIRPKIALLSYGRNNTYGHPSPDVKSRLSAYTERIFETGLNGAVELTFRRERLQIRTFSDIMEP